MTKKENAKKQQVPQSKLSSWNAKELNPQVHDELGINKVIQNIKVAMEDDHSFYQIDATIEEVPLRDIVRILTLSEKNCVQLRNPDISYAEKICNRFNANTDDITFIYDIRSGNSEVLKFWEPNALSFEERLESLKMVNSEGFRTIVFCSYPLDGNTFELVEALSPHCDHLILEITQKPDEFLSEAELTDQLKVQKAEEILRIQSGDWLINLAEKLKGNSTVWWDNATLEFLDSKIGLLC
jgi:hypothetical protein